MSQLPAARIPERMGSEALFFNHGFHGWHGWKNKTKAMATEGSKGTGTIKART
jgi:hypothetical protein